jgi:hypothetical protein
MALLKKHAKEINRKDTAFVGIRVSDEVGSFLTLYSLAMGITKSSIITDLLDTWMEEQEIDEEKLYDEIVERSWEAWKNLPKKHTTFYGYCNMLRTEFKFRGIAPEVIDIIVKKLINAKKIKDEA